MDVVERIIKIAKDKGITGVAIGDLLQLKKSPLTDWKNGKSKPTLEQVKIICEKFSISADYLLLGNCDAKIQEFYNLSNDELELLEIYQQLDSRGQHRLHTVGYEELERMEEAHKKAKEKDAHAG